MFNLQADARNIAKGIMGDLDMDLRKIGIAVTDFNIDSFSYPESVAKMQEKAAAQSMIGDMNRYQQVAVADGMEKGGKGGSSVASDMVGMQMGMMMGQQMVNAMTNNMGNMNGANNAAASPKFCPNCGTPASGANFCGNCGYRLK